MRRALLALILATAWAPACGGDGGTSDADTAAVDGTDATASDVAGDTGGAVDTIPGLEKISKITFKLGGVNNTFDVNGEADYIPNGDPGSLFKISANKATRLIEINILPVDEFAVGSWSDTEFSEVGVLICYNDGTGVRELQACPVGFTHESIAYMVTVADNNGPGSYVQGTFSGTLQDADGGTLEITEGVFDVKHR
ncbi:MAG: hypothetical protein CVU56_00055 [Deltaproteobacteria bacterium HGW-Deltaproteobacteria-14]|jgi:hypothetical protein|nr:MAG: hypothetical protein CVU56_00055 [Deltaproteobacteria bacterium HGW-Deltaproteobacteria-14]